MPRYISAERIKAAVDRLRQSRASGGMVNFLILKRAVKLSDTGKVNLSLKDKLFQQAITEIAWWPADQESDEQRPFIDVFGSLNVKNYGLKKAKYRSNGPADTLKNGAWNEVVAITEGDKSKIAGLQENYRDGLAEMVILKAGNRPMPLLADAAVWYYRNRDVSDIVGESDDDAEIETKLSEAFCEELGLETEDTEILFGKEVEDAE